MAEKKKVLYIVEAMGGGVFTYIVDLANELVNSYDMYIAYAVRKQTPENYKEYFDKRIHLIEVKNFGRAIDPAKDIAAFFEVKKIAEDIKPDVIHLHSSKAGAIGRVAFNGKIPMFYTPHGYSFLMENYKPMKRRMFKLIESVCAKRNCTTISCSVGEHQESLKLTKRATYVNNGINMVELQEIIDKTEKVEHPFTVYTLGRICYQKNPTLFNEIAELLSDVKFVWIGDGELRGELTSKNIEITGWADRTTAIKYAVNDQMHIRSDFRKWFPRMCQYGFIEGRDYKYMPRVRLQDEGGRTVQRYVKDYRITQDMAKKLCKLHHTAVGVAYRPQPFDRDVLLGLLHKKPPRRSSYEAQLSDSDSLVTTTQIAKEYGCGAKVFNRLLHLHGIQYRANGQWVLYSEHHGKGYTSSLTFRLQRSDGSEVEKLHTAWTQKGRKFLYHTLKRRGVLPLAEQGG